MSSDDLCYAAIRGDMKSVRRLVEEEGVDVNAISLNQSTALHFAAQYGRYEVVQFLLENHADVNARGRRGQTPLHIVCSGGRRKQVLIPGIPFLPVIQLLLDHMMTDVNARDSNGQTALHYANHQDARPEVVRLILEHPNVDVNAADKRLGQTALHYAVAYGARLEVLQLLLDTSKIDVNAIDGDGRTSLYFPLRDNIETARCLLDHGANVGGIADYNGETPLHLQRGVTAPVMELLLSHTTTADLHATDKNNLQTPLHALVASDSIQAVGAVLDHLTSSNDSESLLLCLDNRGCIPFLCSQNSKMAKLLLERPLLEDEDQVVPRACREMLFAKDGNDQSLLNRSKGALLDYLSSFTDLPLTIPERKSRTTTTTTCCKHRNKSPHRHVPFHPELNEFQCSIAKVFLNKWDQSFQQQQPAAGADQEDLHVMVLLPDDVKYVIMAYLAPADIMKM